MTSPELNTLYNNYSARLCYFAGKILKDRDAAFEVVSKVFIKLWESGKPYENCENSLMYKMVSNACIDHLRTKKIRKEISTNDFEDIPDTDEVDRHAIQTEYLTAIWEEVKLFPARQREIFIRTYFEGQQAPQIAKDMGITVSSVTTQRQRGMDSIRKKFKEVKI